MHNILIYMYGPHWSRTNMVQLAGVHDGIVLDPLWHDDIIFCRVEQ